MVLLQAGGEYAVVIDDRSGGRFFKEHCSWSGEQSIYAFVEWVPLKKASRNVSLGYCAQIQWAT